MVDKWMQNDVKISLVDLAKSEKKIREADEQNYRKTSRQINT